MKTEKKIVPGKSTLELLAPAGSIEVFEAAVDNGANAVYIGAPYMSARALAKNFSFAEIAAMTDYAHSHGVKIYIAMNSLLKDEEVRDLLKTLKILQNIKVDALIIQDVGIYLLVKRYFPSFKVHASTLSTVHNSLGVQQLEDMGVDRVVLARELHISEISEICSKTKAEIEVFVHGAMCFSYSGLCLFSSFLGGKSSLRGRCVQPCRRLYKWSSRQKNANSGYFFSMNDLMGIDMIPQFQKAGVTSLKLEGRMRSSHYVTSVVKAYRMVLDGKVGDKAIMLKAKEIIHESLGRKNSSGYFREGRNPELISPNHSGNIGLYLGSINRGEKSSGTFTTKENIKVGDRLRIHLEKTGERTAFTLHRIISFDKSVTSARARTKVRIDIPVKCQKGDSLYKVDSKESRVAENRKSKINPLKFRSSSQGNLNKNLINNIMQDITDKRRSHQERGTKKIKFSYRDTQQGRRNKQRASFPLPWWLKTDDIKTLRNLNGPSPDRVVLGVKEENITKGRDILSLKKRVKGLTLALPPIIEEKRVSFFKVEVQKLIRQGCKNWQIGHLSQLQLFPHLKEQRLNIYGDYTLNVLNSLSLDTLKILNLKGAQLSIEADRQTLSEICKNSRGIEVGMTIYGTPPLFTARANPDFFKFETPFVSPKAENFILKKSFGSTVALSSRPFSLLPWVMELAEGGINYMVIDLSHMALSRGTIPALMRTVDAKKRVDGASSFNYLGKLF